LDLHNTSPRISLFFMFISLIMSSLVVGNSRLISEIGRTKKSHQEESDDQRQP
jgi:hypothetical protein